MKLGANERDEIRDCDMKLRMNERSIEHNINLVSPGPSHMVGLSRSSDAQGLSSHSTLQSHNKCVHIYYLKLPKLYSIKLVNFIYFYFTNCTFLYFYFCYLFLKNTWKVNFGRYFQKTFQPSQQPNHHHFLCTFIPLRPKSINL